MRYQIKIQGKIDITWSEWFSGMEIVSVEDPDGDPVTTLTGPVADQASLRGISNRIWDLNLTILSITQIEPDATIAEQIPPR